MFLPSTAETDAVIETRTRVEDIEVLTVDLDQEDHLLLLEVPPGQLGPFERREQQDLGFVNK